MNFKKSTSVVLSATVALGAIALTPSTSEATTDAKLIGSGRHETAVKVSQNGWKTSNSVVLVNDSAIADALAATPFAEEIGAPILLTGSSKLNNSTKNEIKRLGASKVYLIGGKSVLSDNLKNDLININSNMKINRVSGNTREETAIEIAKLLNGIKPVKKIAVVNGKTGLADAVSISAAAAQNDMAIILADKNKGIDKSRDFIQSVGVEKSYVIGGNKAVSDSVKSELPSADRISGSDRNATNAKVIEKFYKSENLNNLYVAKNGSKGSNQLIDALAVGVLAARNSSPVLIVSNKLSSEQVNVIKSKKFNVVTQVGGNGNESAFNEVKKLQGMKVKEYLPSSALTTWNTGYPYYYDSLKISKDKITVNGETAKYKVISKNGNNYLLYLDWGDGTESKIKFNISGNKADIYWYLYDIEEYGEHEVIYNKFIPPFQGMYHTYSGTSLKFTETKMILRGKTMTYKVTKIDRGNINRYIIKASDGKSYEVWTHGNKLDLSYYYESTGNTKHINTFLHDQ